jgi:hypothetical protein
MRFAEITLTGQFIAPIDGPDGWEPDGLPWAPVPDGLAIGRGWWWEGSAWHAPEPSQPDPAVVGDRLWRAATAWEQTYISGSAVGLVTLGVISSAPKCLAVRDWIQSIWTLYYQRKAMDQSAWAPEMLDFSPCGPMPHSVPELMAELGMAP